MSPAQLAEEVRQRAQETGAYVRPYDVRVGSDRRQRRSLKLRARRILRLGTLYVLDGVCIGLAFAVMLLFSRERQGEAWVPFGGVLLLMTWIGLTVSRSYRAGRYRRDPVRLAVGLSVALGALSLLPLILPSTPPVDRWLVGFAVLALAALVTERHLVEQSVIALRRRGWLQRRTLILGPAEDAWEFMRETRRDPGSDLHFVGHLAPHPGSDPTAIGGFESVERLIDEEDVELVVVPSGEKEPRIDEVIEIALAAGVPVVALRSTSRRLACRIELAEDFGPAALAIHPPALRLPELTLKRAFDLTAATLALLILSPAFAVIALLIKLDSSGPVFFRQVRVGVGGGPFRIFKFRSMHVGSEERKREFAHLNSYGDSRLFKIEKDPRITGIGGFLRRTSLDELPQLFNVLLGEMSLVGPRPPLPEEVVGYDTHHFDRLAVLPGVTGPWQIGGRNNILDFEEVVALERTYIREWSLLLDLKILLRTVSVVLKGEGAH